jgi:ElaB/YqjD/DUF883 family membrane-anchored ribosome-binding protein
MASDQVVARELKSLQEELSAAQRERSTVPAALPTQAPSEEESGHASEVSGELRDQLGELASAVTSFLEEAEKGIAAHPAQSVVGALVVGILAGRLLGPRGGR